MTNSKSKYLIIMLVLLGLIAIAPFLKKEIMGEDIRIFVSDNKDEISMLAGFPKTKSNMVHDYLRKKLGLSDLSDLSYLEIKNYQTPDKSMRFYIKSRLGYFKIVIDKTMNSPDACIKLKETGEGLKELLSQQ